MSAAASTVERMQELLTRYEGSIYVIGPRDHELPVKIGYSTSVQMRHRTLCDSSPLPLDILAVTRCPKEWKGDVHAALANWRSHGEWFHRSTQVNEFIAICDAGGYSDLQAWLSARWSRANRDLR